MAFVRAGAPYQQGRSRWEAVFLNERRAAITSMAISLGLLRVVTVPFGTFLELEPTRQSERQPRATPPPAPAKRHISETSN